MEGTRRWLYIYTIVWYASKSLAERNHTKTQNNASFDSHSKEKKVIEENISQIYIFVLGNDEAGLCGKKWEKWFESPFFGR